MKNCLIWIDLEMTGMNPEKHAILEIASAVTDNHLELLAEGPNIAIHQSEDVLLAMDPWSRTQHGASGLIDRVRTSPYDCRHAEEMTLKFISLHSQQGDSPLCGNSVWQDRRFLSKYMPSLDQFLHYRNIDVSSIKELVRRWYPSLPPMKKRKTHVASMDIQESINELRYYRKNVFRPNEPV